MNCWHDYGAAKALVGKKLIGHELTQDNQTLRLFTDSDTVVLETEGECCSHTWIEHIENEMALAGLVTSVEDIPMPDLGNPDQYDVIRYYGLKIVTENGTSIIDYRNNSNGYYGGSIRVYVEEATHPQVTLKSLLESARIRP